MLKTSIRFIVVAALAIALGVLIYHLNQPVAGASFSNFNGFSRDLGEGGFREGSFNLARGLSGVTGDLILVAVVTVIVVSLQKAFGYRREPARVR